MSPLRLPMCPSAVRLLSLVLLAGSAAAASAGELNGRVQGRNPGPDFTLAAEAVNESAAAATAQSATGGKVVGVRRVGPVYEVTVLLTNGQVQLVRVEAATGRIVAD